MNKIFSSLSFAALSFFAAGHGSATVLDDFNRPDSGTLGPNWTQVAGSSQIANNQATGDSLSLATFNGGSGNSVSFDIFNNGYGTQYIAAVIGYGSPTDYFVKVQNNGSSNFDTFGFYTGNNDGSSGVFNALTGQFSSAHVVVTVQGTIATLSITPNVGGEQVYSHDYGVAFQGGGIGLGFYGPASVDNFGNGDSANAVPEPATTALIGLGLLGFAASRRKAAKSKNK